MLFNAENIWQYYYYLAIFATVLFVIKLVLFSIAGVDSEVSTDFNAETDTDASFNFFSIQSILAFFMGFGWMGYGGLKQLNFTNQVQNFWIAFGVGVAFMFVSSFLMFLVRKLEKRVNKDMTSALGRMGRAYTSFSPNSTGQVEIEINGQLSVLNATNDSAENINSFDQIKVTKVVDDMLYITKV